jgi:hypothetical protein
MGFQYKTLNTHNDIRSKRPIAWVDLDSTQVFILSVLGGLSAYFLRVNISLLWKIVILLMLISLGLMLIKKFDDTKVNIVHTEYGRTMFTWFRIYLKKITNKNISIDKGNDVTYFIKK